jgi:anti-sigma B factor antagonist
VPHTPAPPRFTDLLSVTALPGDRPGRVVVEVIGDVDGSTAPLLAACLRTQSGRRGVRELVLDLEQVTFLAVEGVAVLAQSQRRCQMRGARVVIRCGRRQSVLRPLELAGLADVVDIDPNDTEWQPAGARPAASQPIPRPRQHSGHLPAPVCRGTAATC